MFFEFSEGSHTVKFDEDDFSECLDQFTADCLVDEVQTLYIYKSTNRGTCQQAGQIEVETKSENDFEITVWFENDNTPPINGFVSATANAIHYELNQGEFNATIYEV